MGPKTFKEIVDRIFPIRNNFNNGETFDFPFYGNLPKRISNRLSPEAVDAMQHILSYGYTYSRKSDFALAYRTRLLYLGENIKGIKIQ